MEKRRFANINQKYCVACGSCMKVCPKSAIKIPKGIFANVDKTFCIGCGLCAKACPASVITMQWKEEEYEKKETLV